LIYKTRAQTQNNIHTESRMTNKLIKQ